MRKFKAVYRSLTTTVFGMNAEIINVKFIVFAVFYRI